VSEYKDKGRAVGDAVGDAVVGCSQWVQSRDAVVDAVCDAVWGAVRGAVWDAVWDAVVGAVRGSFRGVVKTSSSSYISTYDNLDWIAHYRLLPKDRYNLTRSVQQIQIPNTLGSIQYLRVRKRSLRCTTPSKVGKG
jgi:hypothetical protein